MIPQPSFGAWLKQRRKALDLTQPLLAQQIGCTVSTLYKVEADERRPSRQFAELLAAHLNIPTDERRAFVHFARGETGADATPWQTPFHPPSNVQPSLTPLIGREFVAAAVRKRLLQPQTRLLSLLGPPGVGKTRLALQVAADVLDDFADGVYFVALAPISDAVQLSTTIASTLGVQELGARSPLERLKTFLRDRQALLVLDNFEQILPAAPQIADLLSACLRLKILVTSRAPLRIRPERQFPVPPLTLPDLHSPPDVAAVSNSSAVTLFLERAQAVQPDFALTEVNAITVARICDRLDGLPLAIELISARVKMLSPEALLDRLKGQVLLYSDGLRDIEPRHRTLNNAIEWSYHLLNPNEQTFFRRLGVFVGGWTIAAAEAVCMAGLVLVPLDALASLLDKNLIKQENAPAGEPRFMMLATLGEFALERLYASGEQETLQQRHADYYLGLIKELEVLFTEQQAKQRWDRLEAEYANLRAALVWSRTDPSGEMTIEFVGGLTRFWGRRGHLSEGIGWLAEVAEKTRGARTPESRRRRARMLDNLGVYSQWQGDLDAGEKYIEEAVSIFREEGDLLGLAEAMADYCMVFVFRENPVRAADAIEQSLAIYRELGHESGITECRFFLGNVAYLKRDWQHVTALWEECLAYYRQLKREWWILVVLANLGMVSIERGEFARAHAELTESLQLHRALDEKWQSIQTLDHFARLAVEQAQQPKPENGAISSLQRGARMFGAAEALCEIYGVTILPFHREGHERRVTALRAQLDAASLASAWAAGRKMTLDQAVTYALSA